MQKKCYVNPDIFIDLSQGKTILWNYKTHQEYELPLETVTRLIKLSETRIFIDDDCSKELIDAGLVSFKPFKKRKWKFGLIGRIFNFGTKDILPDKAERITCEDYAKFYLAITKKTWSKAAPSELPERINKLPVIKLPNVNPQKTLRNSIWQVLCKRKTSRAFNGEPISLKDLSTLLYVSFGVRNIDDKFINKYYKSTQRFMRRSPSGGSMQPAMPYVVVLNVTGLNQGIYFYDFINHTLRLIRLINLQNKLGYLCGDQPWANKLAAGVFITARFNRTWFKYGDASRSYRIVLLEVGHLSQNFLLCATALGVRTWITAFLRDTKIENLLGVDGSEEQVLQFLGIGHGSGSAFDKDTYKRLRKEWKF